MKEIKGNAWEVYLDYDVLCLTTNGFVKNDGSCVMGRGIAKEAKDRFPALPKILGEGIRRYGNRCIKLAKVNDTQLISFVVKHNWWEEADIKLIIKSANEVVEMADKFGWKNILLPRPGCGNGKLKWNDVKPILEEILDDRFYVITF